MIASGAIAHPQLESFHGAELAPAVVAGLQLDDAEATGANLLSVGPGAGLKVLWGGGVS